VNLFDNVVIVLSRPQESGNVGAACRSMLNFGFHNLRVVVDAGLPPLNDDIIETRAVHAWKLWGAAQKYTVLADAVKDCGLVIGTSRRRGLKRKGLTWTPREAAKFVADRPRTGGARTAFVFGNERTGLTDEEFRCCNAASYIPASPEFPSLNLSHAVNIYLWELFNSFSASDKTGGGAAAAAGYKDSEGRVIRKPVGSWEPLSQAEIEAQVKNITNTLAGLGFYKKPGREEQEEFLRDMFSRAGITKGEADYVRSIILKAGHMADR
jgi:tRNA/rRNA methyltransferase/tRNA (cytidine32/uridine32-2'-O)-methyltransferase